MSPTPAHTVEGVFAGVETGGTKTVCAIGADGAIMERTQFPTGNDPDALADQIATFFAPREPDVLGIGTFGPCDTDPESPTYGIIGNTPKPGWRDVDLLGLLDSRLGIPMAVTTDVNAAAIGEWHYGDAHAGSDLVYLTIGTGIGGGAVLDGRLLRALRPAEMGHLLLPASATSSGVCPYHAGCFEGLASGSALLARLGRPASEYPDDDPMWDHEAAIVADALHTLTCTLTPDVFVLGGGVGSRDALHDRLPALLTARLNDYLDVPGIRKPALGSDSGVIGAITFAQFYIQG